MRVLENEKRRDHMNRPKSLSRNWSLRRLASESLLLSPSVGGPSGACFSRCKNKPRLHEARNREIRKTKWYPQNLVVGHQEVDSGAQRADCSALDFDSPAV